MWRIERRLLVPAVSVLLVAGLLVPAGAAPPTKAFKPVWTLTQQYDAQGQKVATLKGVLPTDPKGNYEFFYVYVMLAQCDLTDCFSAFSFCGSDLCTLELPVTPDSPVNTDTGQGWTATSQGSRSGLTVTVALTHEFFILDTQVIKVDVRAESADHLPVEAGTKIEQAFH